MDYKTIWFDYWGLIIIAAVFILLLLSKKITPLFKRKPKEEKRYNELLDTQRYSYGSQLSHQYDTIKREIELVNDRGELLVERRKTLEADFIKAEAEYKAKINTIEAERQKLRQEFFVLQREQSAVSSLMEQEKRM